MNSQESIELDQAQREYEHVVTELARYDSDSQKLTSYISLLVTAAFVVGVDHGVDPIFPVVPILTLGLIQYLLSNNYAYRVREIYVHKLERILLIRGKVTPALYHNQLKHFYLDLRAWELALLPFSGAIAYTLLLMTLISIYSSIRAIEYLQQFNALWEAAFWVLIVSMLIYTVATMVWSIWKLSEYSTEVGSEI